MSNSLINTPNETAYRLLLALSVWPENQYSARWISAVDFIAAYGRVFCIQDENLHGNNGMKFTEYVIRIENVDQALRLMVLRGWISASVGDCGYVYCILPEGRTLASCFETSYAEKYKAAALAAYSSFGHLDACKLDEMINQRSVEESTEENCYD